MTRMPTTWRVELLVADLLTVGAVGLIIWFALC